MQSAGYNGWTNYETWNVNLWLSNDHGLYDLVNERAADFLNGAEGSREDAAHHLASWLEDDLCAIGGEYGLIPELTGIAADLLGASLSDVNWFEIASTWLEGVDA